jgi:FMN reductase
MSILLIAASPAATSRSAALLAAAGLELERLGLEPQVLNLRALPAEALLLADARDGDLRDALAQVAQAGAIVIATPIYKAAYSGLLKVFLDMLPQDALRGKIVLPMATGGSAAHLLALDYALQPVLTALGARDVLDAVFAADAQVRWGDGAACEFDVDIRRRVEHAARELSARLAGARVMKLPRPPLGQDAPLRCSA